MIPENIIIIIILQYTTHLIWLLVWNSSSCLIRRWERFDLFQIYDAYNCWRQSVKHA